MNKKVIYTAIFGDDQYLHDPDIIPEGFDFICFTNNENYKSDIWKTIKVTPLYEHNGMNNRKYKVLPHRYLSNYDFSIYADGDLKIIGYLGKLHETYKNSLSSAFDHSLCGINVTGNMNTRNCIYDEANFIKKMGEIHGHYKDNIDVIFKQMNEYIAEGYPSKNGLTRTSLLLRYHNDPHIIKVMESWWNSLKYGSKRDQLSFPYVVWKHKLKHTLIPEDIDYNPWVKLMKNWRVEQLLKKF